MIVSSKGEKEPAAGYITAEDRAKNRRTVISIKK
jgi:flagellar motor protein MotB